MGMFTGDVEKKLDELNKIILELNNNIKTLTTEQTEIKLKVTDMAERLSQIEHMNSDFFSQLIAETPKLVALGVDLNREIEQFKLSRTNIIATITTDISRQLNEGIRKIKTDIEAYETLKASFVRMFVETDKITENIALFNNAISSLKEIDYSLSRYSRQVELADKEKLRLMQQIDSLQKIISIERRNSSRNNLR